MADRSIEQGHHEKTENQTVGFRKHFRTNKDVARHRGEPEAAFIPRHLAISARINSAMSWVALSIFSALLLGL